jgi:hypothetical protein
VSGRQAPKGAGSSPGKLLTSRGFLLFLVLVGSVLRGVQYFSRSSLWVDEAAVALNLTSRPLRELFSPLDLAQVAPWGFLAVEKGLLGLFGRNELGLRLLPFISSLLSLALFERVCRRILRGLAVPFAVGSFAFAAGLIDYSAQLKQYATDVAAAVIILLLAVAFAESGLTPRRALGLGLAGLLASVFSQSVVFVLAGIGLSYVLLAAARRIEAPAAAIVLLGSLWGLGTGFALWSGERMLTPDVKSYMQVFWAAGFMPVSPPATAPAWLWYQMAGAFQAFLGYPLPALFVSLLVVGVIALCRRKLAAALFLLTPLLLTVAASAARLYPFAPGRLTAFLVPALLVFVAEGVERVRTFPSRRLAWMGAVAAAFAAALPAWAVLRNPPPHMREHVRPALERLRSEWRPGDALYVTYGARLAYLFYAPAFDLPIRENVLGECARGDPRSYLRQLDPFRGRPRAWILLAHDVPLFNEGPLIFDYLNRIGRPLERTDFRSHGGSSPVVLAAYDLSDPDKLSDATSETFSVPDRLNGSQTGLTCAGTMGPLRARLIAR